MQSVIRVHMSDNIIPLTPRKILDEAQFERAFKDHFDGMFRYCMTMVKDSLDAEDIVQSVFTDLWNDKEKLEFHTSIQAFLYKGIYFKCMNRIKREKVSQKYNNSLPLNETGAIESNPAILDEVHTKINEAVNALPEQCRKIFTLNRYDGFRYKEIADHLGLSIKTIENQMGKALKSLRIHLADYLQVIIFNLITFF
jgi:RNA polymerase sigma-70 factor, ECF subfamily